MLWPDMRQFTKGLPNGFYQCRENGPPELLWYLTDDSSGCKLTPIGWREWVDTGPRLQRFIRLVGEGPTELQWRQKS